MTETERLLFDAEKKLRQIERESEPFGGVLNWITQWEMDMTLNAMQLRAVEAYKALEKRIEFLNKYIKNGNVS